MQDSTPAFEQLAVVGKAFASPRRLEIIELIAQAEHSVDEIAKATGLGVTTVSAHLQVLRAASLVRTRRAGTRVIYRLADADVANLYAALGGVARRHSPDVSAALAAHRGTAGGEVDEVGTDEALALLARDAVTLLDVRPTEEYETAHITGSVSMPLDEILSRADTLDDRPVVTYCRGAYCVMGHDAVALLRRSGRDARRLEGGLLEWRLAGHPVDAGRPHPVTRTFAPAPRSRS